jgi:hypothetical protein
MKTSIKIKKKKVFNFKTIIIDGFSGSGKTIIAPIISSYKLTQNQTISYDFDNIVILNYLKKLDDQSSIELLRYISEEILYNNEIGRKINLRKYDHTGALYNPKINLDKKKLFLKDTSQIIKKINKQKICLNLMSHKVFLNYNIIKKTFKNDFNFILCIRHPVFLFRHYFNFYKKINNITQDFLLRIKKTNKVIPWYYNQITNQVTSGKGDNILALFFFLFKKVKEIKKNNNFIIIDFENFVKTPDKYLKIIEKKNKIKRDKNLLKKVFKLTKMPRKSVNEGLKFVNYGIINKKLSEEEFYKNELKFIKNKITKKNFLLFKKLINNYNKNWPNLFSKYE